MQHFLLSERFDTRGERHRLHAKRRAGTRGLGERRVYRGVVVLVAFDFDGLAVVHDGEGVAVGDAHHFAGERLCESWQCTPQDDARTELGSGHVDDVDLCLLP